MDFLQNATDDQIALMGCFAALAASAGLMYVSAFLSRTQRKQHVRDLTRHTLPIGNHSERPTTKTESPRKVA